MNTDQSVRVCHQVQTWWWGSEPWRRHRMDEVFHWVEGLSAPHSRTTWTAALSGNCHYLWTHAHIRAAIQCHSATI